MEFLLVAIKIDRISLMTEVQKWTMWKLKPEKINIAKGYSAYLLLGQVQSWRWGGREEGSKARWVQPPRGASSRCSWSLRPRRGYSTFQEGAEKVNYEHWNTRIRRKSTLICEKKTFILSQTV